MIIDLTGQTVTITLNPAAAGTQYDTATGFLHFIDDSGNGCAASTPRPTQRPDNGWWTCFPKPCNP